MKHVQVTEIFRNSLLFQSNFEAAAVDLMLHARNRRLIHREAFLWVVQQKNLQGFNR